MLVAVVVGHPHIEEITPADQVVQAVAVMAVDQMVRWEMTHLQHVLTLAVAVAEQVIPEMLPV